MHMADGLISPAVGAVMYGLSGAAAIYSAKKLKEENESEKIPLMGVMGAFVFAAQMINFTIPGTGSSGHLCGGVLLSSILGPYGGFITMIAILALQCFMFADGGILALGCNIWNMAFYGCFIGYFCIYHQLTKNKMSNGRIMLASILASVMTLQLGAFSVTLETLISGVTKIPFGTFLLLMQPIHLAIGFVEGVVTGLVLIFIYGTRPEILEKGVKSNKMSYKQVLIILSVAVLLIGGAVSLFASSYPDGLEWSIENITGSTDVETDGSAYTTAQDIQDKTALMPDYSVGENEAAGTSISGIVGSVITAIICAALCFILRKSRRKTADV